MVLLGARRPKIGGPELGARVQQKCSRELCYLTGFLCVVHVWCSRESCTFPIHGCSVWLPDLTDRLKPVGRRSSVMSLLKFRIQKIGKYRGVENRGPYPLRKNQNPLNESRHPRESCRGYDAPLHRAKSTEKDRHLLGRGEILPCVAPGLPSILHAVLASRYVRSSTCRRHLARFTNESSKRPEVAVRSVRRSAGRTPRQSVLSQGAHGVMTLRELQGVPSLG